MDNIKDLQTAIRSSDIDALLLIDPNNRRYATGFHTTDGFVFISLSEAVFLTDSRYSEAAGKNVTGARVQKISGEEKATDLINGLIAAHGVKKLGIEEESLSHGEYLKYESALTARLIPSQKVITDLRQIKKPWEIDAIRAAQEITERVFEDMLGILKRGLTEKEIAAEIICRLYHYGGEKPSFDPIVVTGARSSMPHGVPGPAIVQSGDFVTMDFGCVKDGYCSDMTRTVAVGGATEKMRTVYETVLAAQQEGIRAAKAGVAGCKIDAAARTVIEDAGYGKFFGHSFGHGIGLDVHEPPSASPFQMKPIPAGAVISAEPGIYIPGSFGVRIEDMILITQGGCENLTKAPKNLIIL